MNASVKTFLKEWAKQIIIPLVAIAILVVVAVILIGVGIAAGP